MASGTFSTTTNMAGFLELPAGGSWSTTTDAANNRSFLSVSFSVAKRTGFSTTFGNGSWTIFVEGVAYPSGTVNRSVGPGQTVLIHSISGVEIPHLSTGVRNLAISISGGIPATSWSTTTGSTTAVLDDYDRSPVFTTANAPTPVTRGAAYTGGQFTASNTSSYSRTGTLPPGLTFNTSNGALTGTPNTVGSYNFTITANGQFEGSATSNKTVVVNPALPVFSDSTVATATRGTSYSDGFAASETANYALRNLADNADVSAPPGLSFNTTTGALTGTPTTVGNTEFRVRATNVTGSTTTGTITFTVNPAVPVFSDSTVNSSSRAGVAYSDGVSASEVPSNGYSVRNSENTGVGTLPPGLNLNASTGAITGTPTTSGTYLFRIRATNVTGSADTSVLTITIFGGSKMWNGTSFANLIPRIWNGTSYVESVPRIWNGSAWVRI
jgi:hypothetical protein